MAITIINEPQAFTPAYNDLFFIVDSTNKNEDAYRYVIWTYINGSLAKKDKIIPQFGVDKYGKIHLSKVVSSYLSFTNIFPKGSVAGAQDGENTSYVDVQIRVGEEYIGSNWDFDGYIYAGSVNWTNSGDPSINPGNFARIALRSTTTMPPYSQGDMIDVTLTDDNTNSFIGGIHKVLDVENTSGTNWIVVLELPWQTLQTPSTFAGETQYADGTKVEVDPTGSSGVDSTEIIAFNGAIPFKDFKDWNLNDWLTDDPSAKFLTSVPRDVRWGVRPDSVVFLQYYNDVGQTRALRFIEEPPGLNDDYVVTSNVDGVVMVDASPNRITFPDGDYNVYLHDDQRPENKKSEELKFKILTCAYEFEDVEVVFMDRLGSIMPFQFRLRKTKRTKNEKDYYKKDIDTDEMYDYSLLDGGKLPVSSMQDVTYIIRTDHLSFDEATYLSELTSSPFTAVRFGSGEYMRCNVLTNGLTIQDQYAKEPQYYEIEIELSNKDKINW